ncbi:MAG: hypothetical protein KA746_13760 [Pyrinomonadaceae bacterium]|nr:hypothetical protein [Pyrinomonadaceae bacterium]MBP6211758.1 hypothetical protein [Pyrinomonadaceae bacterium]
MTDIKICEHEICDCSVTGEEHFCSDHCREATKHKINEIKCDCGCPACK